MLIDTHAHLWYPDYDGEVDEVLARARAAGVEKIVVPGTDIVSSKKAIELSKKYPGLIYAAVGVHPEEVLNSSKARPYLASSVWALPSRSDLVGAVAVGEIGMDMSSDELRSKSNEQAELFRMQCEMAIENDLPVIIHTRNSFAEAWEVLTSLPKLPRGQFHCFSNDEEDLTTVIAAGFFVSFCGNITWSKRVARLVPLVPADKLLLETDSPFMKPGETNEPAYVAELLKYIAGLRGEDKDDLEKVTSENAKELFRL